ncbi:hypothetical protein AKJ55_01760 [candidate division MSBL1 archaeon SCGC-AAA382M17]|uniref:Uncharacterized protein n=1 Tax=candidate division MSBL1 archaeon SCGC-AAA382M17 TaxID=1698284 RepID=A0ABR5TML8_9EURY|nr:hypothetical protein AKJ55_01760 [candidate division MSBL1 archaeon SCGC-AAA382M17]
MKIFPKKKGGLMTSTLIRDGYVITMDTERREFNNADIPVEDNKTSVIAESVGFDVDISNRRWREGRSAWVCRWTLSSP